MPAIESMYSRIRPILTSLFELNLIKLSPIYLSDCTGMSNSMYEFYKAFSVLSGIIIFSYYLIGNAFGKKLGAKSFKLSFTYFNFDSSHINLVFVFSYCLSFF